MTDGECERYVRDAYPAALVAKQRKRDGMRYQIVKRMIVTTKLYPLGGWCKTETAAWRSAVNRMKAIDASVAKPKTTRTVLFKPQS